jgi:hypothetical protein
MMPPEMLGWKSVEIVATLAWLKGSDVSLATMAAGPWHLAPSNVNKDWSWYRLASAARLLPNRP